MTAPLEVSGSASEAQPEAVLAGAPGGIQGRSLTQIAWMRLKRDRFAIVGFILICVLILIAIFAPLIVKLLGHPPNEVHQDMIDPSLQTPPAPRGGMSLKFLLGVEPVNGRDLFSRIVYGARISLLV